MAGTRTGGSLRAHGRGRFHRQGLEPTQGLGKTNRLRSGALRPKEGVQMWKRHTSEDKI